MECFRDNDGTERCYTERQVQEGKATFWFLVCAFLLILAIAGSFVWSEAQKAWATLEQPVDLADLRQFAEAMGIPLLFGLGALVFGMGFALQVFGAFRGPGSTPGPVMRDMSRGDHSPPWGDALPRR